MMTITKLAGLLTATMLLGGCGLGLSSACEKPQTYEFAQQGKRIDAPEGLDSLEASREMTIPEASPRAPRSKDDPCLELPPVYRPEG